VIASFEKERRPGRRQIRIANLSPYQGDRYSWDCQYDRIEMRRRRSAIVRRLILMDRGSGLHAFRFCLARNSFLLARHCIGRLNGLSLLVQEGLGRDPFAGDIFVFRGRAGSLIKALGMTGSDAVASWPATVDDGATLTAAQMSCLLEAIDWRNCNVPDGRRVPDRLKKCSGAKKPPQIARFAIPSAS
jgi:transposase